MFLYFYKNIGYNFGIYLSNHVDHAEQAGKVVDSCEI